MKAITPLIKPWGFAEPRWLDAQMEVLDRNMLPALGFSALTAWLTAFSFWWALHDPRVSVWALLLSALILVGLGLRWWLPRPGTGDVSASLRYARYMLALWCLIGAGWGGLGVVFIEPGHVQGASIILAVIAAITSAGLAVFAPCRQIALAYWLPCVLPVAGALMLAQGAVNLTLALGSLIYLWAMTIYADGTSRAALHSIALRFENQGLVERLREQTQRAQEARQLAEVALGEAEQANRSKAVFLASASHDLRQPLHAAGLFMGALSRESLSPRQRHLLTQTQASACAAGEMLDTLMDFSKVDAGVIKPQPRPFALQQVFHRLQREVAPLAEEAGLAFRMRDTNVQVNADPSLVEMIVRNLLLNAVRYTPHGAVLLACRQRGARAVIEVWDTGIGIASHQHQAIFQEFHQLGNPERDRRKGLGLGLAIVAGLARAMAVDVTVASQPGRGSVFRLALPLTQASVTPVAPSVAPSVGLQGLRVLLIEDDPCVLAAMADLLDTLGCVCVPVTSGDEGLAALEGFVPEVIVSDYRLRSHHTGVDAIHAITASLGHAVPAVIVTGDTAAERLREAHASGLMLLHKPVPAETLCAALVSLSGRQGAQAVSA